MTGARRTAESARVEVGDTLANGRQRAGGNGRGAAVGPHAVLALQRSAGNAAVSALMAARLRSPGEQAVTDIDAALREFRRDEPVIDTVGKGLKAAKAAGVPVDLEGPKPPASALAVTVTGFGPAAVAAKKPVPPPKPVPAVSPLGKAGAKARGRAGGKAPANAHGGTALAAALSGVGATAMAPAPLSADHLLQPPVSPTTVRPDDDPAFAAVKGNVTGFARAKKAHPSAASKAKEAQDAALAPTDDIAGQAKAAKVDTMDAQQAGTFDKRAFIAAVKAAIGAKSPKTLKEADDYKSSGKAGEVKGEVKGLVTQGTQGQAKDIETATDAAPDQSKAVAKPVAPMSEEQPGQAVPIPAVGAVPKPAPAEQTNLEAGKHQVNQEMAEAEVTDAQLAQSGEPAFESALADKEAAAAHADTAPAEFRQHEQAVIQHGKAEAAAETASGVASMQGAKGAALAKLVADKGKTKSKDEAKRAEVTAKIQSIFAATEAGVKKILDGIDPQVESVFEQGEATARASFESYVAAKMSAYKKDRYGGWLGRLRWAKDKLLGMPSKVNEFYEAGRELYLKQMDGVISRVADIVGNDLTAAKKRIAAGRAEIAAYVKSLPADLKKVGAEASKEIGDRFAQLERDVEEKQEATVDALATKYVEARKGLDERIEALQAENKGLVDKAVGAIKAVINTIRELVAVLKNVLARAAGVVGEIIKNPVGFLGNLIAGVKGGILKFKDNILDHLRKGLMSWLFGALAEGGVELPATFDVKGIIKLLASIFGLTWANIRNRIVRQIGERAMTAAEKGVEIFQVLASQGVAGLWQMLIEKLGDIKEMILEQVKDFVITKIITAGITWLIGLLNPAAAFIKACKLIYDVVMFFVNNASRIAKFVNTVLDSVAEIARGNISGVVEKINNVLGQMVPILIGFLASAIGLGGIGQKIRQIVETLQKPVNKALDFVIKTGLKLAGPIIRGIAGISGKVKAKVAAGKAWAKGKIKTGVRKVGETLGIVRKPFRAGAESHTLSVDPKTGQFRMASTEGPLREKIRARVAALQGRWRKEGRAIDVESHVNAVMAQIDRAQNTITSARANAGPAAQAQLDRLAPLVADLLIRIGAAGTQTNRDRPSGLGNIAPHGSQPSRHSGDVPERMLESEHIIPVRLVSTLLEQLGETEIIERGSSEDNRQHTILIYKSAATAKTRGIEGADWNFIRQLKAIAAQGTPTIEGRNITAKRIRQGGAERLAAARASFAAKRNQLKSTLVQKLPALFTSRIKLTANKVQSDHADKAKQDLRGHMEPLPTEDKIRTAAALQAQDIVAIVTDRLPDQ
ncbi:phage tail protein [Micromonospora sp. DT47]|uniref:phage tail protein n=1 Tax=Micromonospora sp. DT47 TaxID=3393431 RepID=UPI003CF71155